MPSLVQYTAFGAKIAYKPYTLAITWPIFTICRVILYAVEHSAIQYSCHIFTSITFFNTFNASLRISSRCISASTARIVNFKKLLIFTIYNLGITISNSYTTYLTEI